MNANPPESRFDRWWWRAWYVFVGLVLIWLVWCAWLTRPLAPWSQGWVGWWTGDQAGHRSLWNFHTHLSDGTDVAAVEGNRVLRTVNGAFVELGHWNPEGVRWTWAGWIRITTPDGVWPTNFLVVRSAQAPLSDLRIGFDSGRPRAMIFATPAGVGPTPAVADLLANSSPVPLATWVHLAVTVDRMLQRVLVNGRTVAERRDYLRPEISLASLRLKTELIDPETRTGHGMQAVVEQDDVVVYDRAVSPDELALLAERGRGAWATEIERPLHATEAWERGWPVATLWLVGLIALRVMPRARYCLSEIFVLLGQSEYRVVRWTLFAGALITGLITLVVAVHARRADYLRFSELLRQSKQDTTTEWARLADLSIRAKDWITTQTNLTQTGWETWLSANRFPYDYPGALGIGYAEQVLPDRIAAHEAEWTAKHGFAYRVHPSAAVPRQPVIELAGDPRLPVVVYRASKLDRTAWFTNHSILGRDLLFQAAGDPRWWAEARRVEEVAARNELQTSSLEEIAPAGWYGAPVQGLRLYVPWTLLNKHDDPDTVLPSDAWHGVVFTSVDVKRELRDRFATSPSPLGFRLYAGTSTGERLDLVADSGDFLTGAADRPDAYLRRTVDLSFFYRRLYLDAWTTPEFEEQSRRHWPWIAAGAGGLFTLLTAGLLFVQVRARAEQAKVLEALRTANADLQRAQREREQLSRDLHDGSIQNLYGLGLHLQRVQTLLTDSPERARSGLNDSLAMLDQSIAELRQFILTAGVDHLPLHTVTSALEGLIERLRKTTPIDLHLHLEDTAAVLSPRAGVEVLNIVREAISNVLRHAEASRVEVRLSRVKSGIAGQPDQWRLSVTDDGHGFDVKQINGHGRGLKNLASRAAELGGRCDTRSAPGSGTQVVVEFPG